MDHSLLLDVRDLRTLFETDRGVIPAVDGVSLRVERGKTVALVGESGCGKSVTALSIMRLLPEPIGRIAAGRILLSDSPDGGHVDLVGLDDRRMRRIRGNRIAMIFQEPLTALNPVYSIGQQIVEAIELHQSLRGKAAWAKAVDLLRTVRIAEPEQRARAYPHQLSGGMRQRVMIAMAVACRPSLLIADEPTTALDVTVQAQILDLLSSLQVQTGMSILLITHDLGVVAQVADFVYVMYAGRIVECAPTQSLFAGPLHPYTQGLLRCTPRVGTQRRRLDVIPGSVPELTGLPTGCRFHPRCRLTAERARNSGRPTCAASFQPEDAQVTHLHESCERSAVIVLKRCVEADESGASGVPKLRELRPGHYVACWEADEPATATTERPDQ